MPGTKLGPGDAIISKKALIPDCMEIRVLWERQILVKGGTNE